MQWRSPRLALFAALALSPLLIVLDPAAEIAAPQAHSRHSEPQHPASASPRAIAAPVLLGDEELPPDTSALARNTAVPFASGALHPAPPFEFTGSPGDRTRARDCLALAAMAEAGESDQGQRAVIQVVLNRVRHPAFAATVCGAVFAGASRRTGCQFSFTCDGSLARRYGEIAWARARSRADDALDGLVFGAVGPATHFHADYVYPAWSPELVKLAKVDRHLFFRWPGAWGTPAVWRRYRGGEPAIALFGPGGEPSPAASASAAPTPGLPVTVLPETGRASGAIRRDASGRASFITVGDAAPAALSRARALCGASLTCRVYGWADPAAIPPGLPLSPTARRALAFSYARDPSGAEIVLYDCTRYAGIGRDQCIPRAR